MLHVEAQAGLLVTAQAHDPAACTMCVYRVAIYAINGPTRYTLMATVARGATTDANTLRHSNMR